MKLYLKETKLEEALSIIDSFTKENSVPQSIGFKLKLVFEELVTNVFKYATKLGADFLQIDIKKGKDSYIINLRYNGDEFDVTASDSADINEDLSKRMPGRVGLFLVKKISKVFQYKRENKENIINVEIAAK